MEAERLALEEPVEWFLDQLRFERGASPHTIEAYQRDLSGAIEFFASRKLEDWRALSAALQIEYESTLGPPLAQSTAQRRLSSLRSFLKFLKRNGQGATTDLPSTGGFRKAKTLPKALSVEQMERLLSIPDLATPTGLRDRAMMELIYGAGLRVSEAVGLETADVFLDIGVVRVLGKRGKVRQIPLPEQTVRWIGRYLDDARPALIRDPSGLLFLSDKGLPMLRQTVYHRLERHSTAAGLHGVSPHVLRHSYAVHLVRGGADLRAVQELLGHASVATTQIYTQLDLDEVRRKYDRAHPRD